ncbi:MAG: hypothetical protein Q9201_003661 [Fulgogasparrea decipioides]
MPFIRLPFVRATRLKGSRINIDQYLASRRTFFSLKSKPNDAHDILPRQPTWSLEDLFEKDTQEPETQVSEKELYYLLRLSALPLPKDLAEQRRMQKELQSQLKFVKAIQKIEIGDDVKPLQGIRDETEQGMREQEFTCASLAEEFKKEEIVGIRGRIKRKKEVKAVEGSEDKWDPLALPPRTVGRYVAVNTARD